MEAPPRRNRPEMFESEASSSMLIMMVRMSPT